MKSSDEVDKAIEMSQRAISTPGVKSALASVAAARATTGPLSTQMAIISKDMQRYTGLNNSLIAAAQVRPVIFDVLEKTRFANQVLLDSAQASLAGRQAILQVAQGSLVARQNLLAGMSGIIDARVFAGSFLMGISEQVKQMANLMVDLRAFSSLTSLNLNTSVAFNLISATELDEKKQTTLHSTAVTTKTYGSVTFRQSAEISVIARLETVEGKQDTILHKLDKLDTLEQLIRSGSHQLIPARVESFEYVDNQPPILSLNGKPITLDGNSKQNQLCRLFFSSKDTLFERLHIEDIYWALQTNELPKTEAKKWNNSFYQAARHLNSKVAAVLGTDQKLIIVSGQYYQLNENLLNL